MGAGFLRFDAEKRPLTKTEKETLPLHPLDGAGGFKRHQTEPRMELYRDGATLYKCTPTETADLSFPPHHTQAERRQSESVPLQTQLIWLFVFLTIRCNFDRRNVQTEPTSSSTSHGCVVLLCVVCSEASKAGVSVSPEHHAKFYLTTILHSALYTFTAHRKILCSVCISDKTQ